MNLDTSLRPKSPAEKNLTKEELEAVALLERDLEEYGLSVEALRGLKEELDIRTKEILSQASFASRRVASGSNALGKLTGATVGIATLQKTTEGQTLPMILGSLSGMGAAHLASQYLRLKEFTKAVDDLESATLLRQAIVNVLKRKEEAEKGD